MPCLCFDIVAICYVILVNNYCSLVSLGWARQCRRHPRHAGVRIPPCALHVLKGLDEVTVVDTLSGDGGRDDADVEEIRTYVANRYIGVNIAP